MITEVSQFIKSPPLIWIEIDNPDTEIRDLIESIIFHIVAASGCFGGWCLTMWLFFYYVRPV